MARSSTTCHLTRVSFARRGSVVGRQFPSSALRPLQITDPAAAIDNLSLGER